MAEQPTETQIDSVNQRAGVLVDELYATLAEVCDPSTAYLSAMQSLLARSGLDAQAIVDAITTLLAHNLCGDRPIRLAIVPVEAPPPGVTKH